MSALDNVCRLCAEPTQELIYADEEAAINSKISAKMLWINIDVSTSNIFPKAICYSCFDLLERTWIFLHRVREAQNKLKELFYQKNKISEDAGSIPNNDTCDVGKPVDLDWDEFHAKIEVKVESSPENLQVITTVDPRKLMKDLHIIKSEMQSDDENRDCVPETDGFLTTDSDQPLLITARRKKLKKVKLKMSDSEVNERIDISNVDITWEEQMCRCGICDAQCKNIVLLRLHSVHIHDSCCVFKCVDCGKIVSNFKSFVNHVRGHHNVLRYVCEYCNEKFTMTSYVKKHKNVVHKDIFLTSCQSCGACFESQELLQDHKDVYGKKYKKKGRKRYDDVSEVDLKCEYCYKEFKTRSNLQQHKLVHTDRTRNFSCHVCGKMFFTKGTLGTHLITHDEVKPYKCEFCPMAFKAKGNLHSHVSLHSGAKPFVCEQCGKSFRVKRHLKSHSIVHTDLMPYSCDYCNKEFRFKTRLNLHLRQHTGAKPYTCEFCQRDFTNGSNFKKHMKRRHNVDTSKRKYNTVNHNVEINNDEIAGKQM